MLIIKAKKSLIYPFTLFKRTLILSLITFFCLTMVQWYWLYPSTQAQEKEIKKPTLSRQKEQARWLTEWRANAEKDQLYLYAVKLFKAPIDYKAKITDSFEGNYFGSLLFSFSGGAKLTIETFPPESSCITLRVPKGFNNEREAHSLLEQYVREIGIDLKWKKPSQHKNGGEPIQNFYPLEPDLNATASKVFKNRKLIELGFSMAL